jgi:hypothetical protein
VTLDSTGSGKPSYELVLYQNIVLSASDFILSAPAGASAPLSVHSLVQAMGGFAPSGAGVTPSWTPSQDPAHSLLAPPSGGG